MAYPKVTIVGAGNVGATAATIILLKEIANVVLVDVVEGMPQGKALDLMHMRSIEKFGPRIVGTNDYAETAGSDVVVITAGIARKPGMSREDLLDTNARILSSVLEQAVEASPDAVFIIVTNPLDIMADLAYGATELPRERLIGMGGVLDSARFAYEIAQATDASIDDVSALVVGAHGKEMVPLARFSSVRDEALTDLLSEEEIRVIEQKTVDGGAEVVSLLKTGSAFSAPAASIAQMVEAIVGDTRKVMSTSVYLEGEYGIEDVFLCVPAALGAGGLIAVKELDLDEHEMTRLNASAESVKAAVAEFKSSTRG